MKRNIPKLFYLYLTLFLLTAAGAHAQTTGFVQQTKLTASDGGALDDFATSVAILGDTAVIGARRENAAYVFVRNGTTWTQQAKIKPTGVANDDNFGWSVAISGETILVGANFDDEFFTNQGSVYVFTRSGTTWTQQAKLLTNDAALGDTFGSSVALENDTAVIGAQSEDSGTTLNNGAVYVFTRSGTTWTQTVKLLANDAGSDDEFGGSVGIEFGNIVVGAQADDVGSNNNQGSAYVFLRSGATWTQAAKLTAIDGAANANFGRSVAIGDENTIVVGAVFARSGNPLINAGAVYVFNQNGAAWTQTAKLLPTDLTSGKGFGHSVAIGGNSRIAVGAWTDIVGANSAQGSAYIFDRAGATWSQSQKLTADDGGAGERFGNSISLSGPTVLVGAYNDNIGTNEDQGSAYVFVGDAIPSGSRIADFDGDGKSDLSVFRPSNGAWYISGSQSGFTGAAFGASGDKIVPADYDGDGKTDLAVYRQGVWYLQRSQAGFAGVSFGAADDIPVPADYDGDGKADVAVFRPSNGTWYLQRSQLGFSGVAFGAAEDKPTIGDFDGDGKADVAVFRPSNGTWYRINSSNSQVSSLNFGAAKDLVVPADYDADGKTDVAVFRPSTGTWYLQRSQLGFIGIAFGQAGDKPVAADYDGDGKADVAVYRAGIWYIQQSLAGFAGVSFGASDDLPAPNAFVR